MWGDKAGQWARKVPYLGRAASPAERSGSRAPACGRRRWAAGRSRRFAFTPKSFRHRVELAGLAVAQEDARQAAHEVTALRKE